MPISSNRRQRVIEFATPKVADLVIVERVDSSKNVNAAATAYDSTYGTAHPDDTRFPNFKLALIKNSDDDQGQFQDWYYVKDRANQDDYNWEFQAAGADSPRYDTVVRTYVILRTDYENQTPYVGYNIEIDAPYGANSQIRVDRGEVIGKLTFMPTGSNSPFNEETLNNGSDDAAGKFDTSYILFEKKQIRSGDDFLDTLYVVEQRVFVKRVGLYRVDVDDAFPYNTPSDGEASSVNFGGLISKETIVHRNEPLYATIRFIDADDDDDVDGEGVQETTTGTNQNLELVNQSITTSNIAGYVFTNPHATYSVSGASNTHDGEAASTTYNFWGVDDFGVSREGKQLSDNWFALVERQVVETFGTSNQINKYTTYQNYSWPAVLDGADVADEDGQLGGDGISGFTWTRKNGGGDTVVYPVYKRHAYSGPTKIEITLFWRKEKFAVDTNEDGRDGGNSLLTNVVTMQPIPISFVSPLESLNVGPTLHSAISIFITTGTEHPVWELAGAQFDYAATNYTDWPTSIIISDTQKPYRGGWLRERVKAFRPELGPGATLVNTNPTTSDPS